jgi:hypothetical protein
MEYEAGSCNIDRTEQRKRYYLGAAGLSFSALYLGVNYAYNMSQASVLLVALPSFLGFLGVLQGYQSFCAGYGIAGSRNAENGLEKVGDKEDTKKDRKTALKIIGEAFGLSAALSSIAYLTL